MEENKIGFVSGEWKGKAVVLDDEEMDIDEGCCRGSL